MASKYELEVKMKGSTAYQKDGQKRLVHDNKFLPRWWVEDRNMHENNELYLIDEEATEEAYKLREQSIKDNELKKKKESVTMADLVGVVAEAVSDKPKKKKAKKVVLAEDDSETDLKDEPVETNDSETIEELEDYSVEELQHYCSVHGIKYHHKAGKSKLLELIKNK